MVAFPPDPVEEEPLVIEVSPPRAFRLSPAVTVMLPALAIAAVPVCKLMLPLPPPIPESGVVSKRLPLVVRSL